MANSINGFYLHEESGRYLPAFSTVKAVGGDSFGLVRWAAKTAAKAVVWELAKCRDGAELLSRLKTDAAISWAEDVGVAAYGAEGSRTASIGTNCHKIFEKYFEEKERPPQEILDELLPVERKICKSFFELAENVKLEASFCEKTVFNLDIGYAGTADVGLNLTKENINLLKPYLTKHNVNCSSPKPGLYLGDYKTGSFYEHSHMMQLGAYKAALDGDVDIEGGIIINIQRESPDKVGVILVSKETLVEGFENFYNLYNFWKSLAPKWWLKQEMEIRNNG